MNFLNKANIMKQEKFTNQDLIIWNMNMKIISLDSNQHYISTFQQPQ